MEVKLNTNLCTQQKRKKVSVFCRYNHFFSILFFAGEIIQIILKIWTFYCTSNRKPWKIKERNGLDYHRSLGIRSHAVVYVFWVTRWWWYWLTRTWNSPIQYNPEIYIYISKQFKWLAAMSVKVTQFRSISCVSEAMKAWWS